MQRSSCKFTFSVDHRDENPDYSRQIEHVQMNYWQLFRLFASIIDFVENFLVPTLIVRLWLSSMAKRNYNNFYPQGYSSMDINPIFNWFDHLEYKQKKTRRNIEFEKVKIGKAT